MPPLPFPSGGSAPRLPGGRVASRRVEREELEHWTAAGRWDVTQGLMPMATYHLSVGQRKAYALGYRSGPIGLAPNAYQDERRPQRSRSKATPSKPPR